MSKKSFVKISFAVCLIASLSLSAFAQTQVKQASSAGDTKAPAQKRISFRTVKAVSGHFNTDKEVSEMEKTLKQLGCETKRSQHNGHIDLSYECKFWKTLNLKDQAEADKWNKWLSSKGFVVLDNTPAKTHKETVKYQVKDWRTMHFNDSTVAKAHVEMFKMLGCEVTTAQHNGHEDVKFRCTTWQEIGVPSHAIAHAWMGELKKLGFATLHEH